MIFNELVIHNFGLYQGKHTVNLTVSDDKPVILIGALNGGGKSPFLDALQLVLYGKHAKCSNRASMAYGNFLASSKNRFAPMNEQVLLSLSFLHHTDNKIKRFDIERSWEVKSMETKDKVRVLCDHQYDEHLSQYWDDFVNEFIPLSLSDLFFFDGEKIENLAHPQRSAELVKTGIESLLGLDLLSQLQIDLAQLDKKRRTDNVDQNVIAKVEACENEVSHHNETISNLKKELAEVELQLSDTNISINKARQSVRNAGAHLIEKRDDLKFELGALEAKLKLNQIEQVKLATGAGPLGLVGNLIEQTKVQIQLETQAKQAKVLDESISIYNDKILTALHSSGAEKNAIQHVNTVMLDQANDRKKLANIACYLNSDLSIFNGLDERIAQEEKQRQRLKKERARLLEQQALYQK